MLGALPRRGELSAGQSGPVAGGLAIWVRARKLSGASAAIFAMAQRYGTDGTHAGMAVFDTMGERFRDFRVALYVIGYWWAALFLVRAAAAAVIIHQTRFSTGYENDQVLPVVAAALGMAGSLLVGRRATVRGRARRAAAITGADGAGTVIE